MCSVRFPAGKPAVLTEVPLTLLQITFPSLQNIREENPMIKWIKIPNAYYLYSESVLPSTHWSIFLNAVSDWIVDACRILEYASDPAVSVLLQGAFWKRNAVTVFVQFLCRVQQTCTRTSLCNYYHIFLFVIFHAWRPDMTFFVVSFFAHTYNLKLAEIPSFHVFSWFIFHNYPIVRLCVNQINKNATDRRWKRKELYCSLYSRYYATTAR
jgi:hypothetical protein